MRILLVPSVGLNLNAAALLRLRGIAPGYTHHLHHRVLPEWLPEIEIVAGAIAPAFLAQMPALQWLHLPQGGAGDYADLRLYANRAVTVTLGRGIYAAPVAEHVLGMTLALLRLRAETADEVDDLCGKQVLMLGMGSVGRRCAALFQAFGCRVTGIRRNFVVPVPDAPGAAWACHPLTKLLGLLPQTEILVNCLPSTPQTRGVLDTEAFNALKPGALFLDVGGDVCAPGAVLHALQSGRLGGFGQDTTTPDPALAVLPNVLLTPKTASASPQADDAGQALFEENLALFLAKKRVKGALDFFAGY